MAFDRRAGRIVALAGGETWAFDVCTNTWTQMHPERRWDAWVQLVYDVDSDLTIRIDSLTSWVWAYDLGADIWTLEGPAPPGLSGPRRPIYDPVSGLVVVQAQSELWTYDVGRNAWTPVRVANPLAAGPPADRRVLAYDASVDRLVAFADLIPSATNQLSGRTWLFDRHTGMWGRSAAPVPEIGFGYGPTGGEIVYDEATERTVIYCGRQMVAYHAATDSWETLWPGDDPVQPEGIPTGSLIRFYHTVVYDPINQRLVVYGGQHPTSDSTVWVGSDDVLAFDPATRQWSVLLEAGTMQPIQ